MNQDEITAHLEACFSELGPALMHDKIGTIPYVVVITGEKEFAYFEGSALILRSDNTALLTMWVRFKDIEYELTSREPVDGKMTLDDVRAQFTRNMTRHLETLLHDFYRQTCRPQFESKWALPFDEGMCEDGHSVRWFYVRCGDTIAEFTLNWHRDSAKIKRLDSKRMKHASWERSEDKPKYMTESPEEFKWLSELFPEGFAYHGVKFYRGALPSTKYRGEESDSMACADDALTCLKSQYS